MCGLHAPGGECLAEKYGAPISRFGLVDVSLVWWRNGGGDMELPTFGKVSFGRNIHLYLERENLARVRACIL